MVGPWITFLQDEGDMGDLEYIQNKVVDGDYFQVSGDIDAVNDTIEYVPASGKTAFLIEAKIVPNNSSTSNNISAALKINGTTVDEAQVFRTYTRQAGSTNFGGSGAGNGDSNPKFNVLGISLVGDAAKKIEIENIADAGGAFATMSGYVIDT